MAVASEEARLELPERWVHADDPPAWTDLEGTLVAFVRWRRDRWPSLERLHRLHRAVRASDEAALVLGVHATPDNRAGAERVRDALLARGTWAPSAILAADETHPSLDQPGAVALVHEGTVQSTFAPDADLEAILDAVSEAAEPGDVAWTWRGAAPGPWPVAFPSDVATSGSRVAVADTGHNRLLAVRPGGDVTHIVGEGVPDLRDGSLGEARFQAPRGVTWRGDELIVSDTGNDAIRRVDLAEGTVSTLVQAPDGSLPAGLSAEPDGSVLVALAGEGRLARLEDGALAPLQLEARLGHPVDVAAGDPLAVADLEGPSVERIPVDGSPDTFWSGLPLEEPVGLHAAEEGPLVADAGQGGVLGLAADGSSPREFLPPGSGIEEPTALASAADSYLVPDGGGHHIWRVPGDAEGSPTRLRLTEPPLSLAEHIRLDPVELAPDGRLELALSYLVTGEGGVPETMEPPSVRGPVRDLEVGDLRTEEGRVRVDLVGRAAASGSVRVRWSLTPGEVGHEAAWDLPLVVRPGSDTELRLALSTSPR